MTRSLNPALEEALHDRYTLQRELGHGGMATVYLAHDLKHDRGVAIKVLRPDLAAVLGRERFLAEIRLTAKLDHPHILTLIDSGESEGFLWYVVPFIRGESLRQKLAREKQLSVAEALAITKQVAGALDYAHRQGVIHRDIKPENILLHEGEAMLADFGIALAVKEAAGNRLTETGLSLGTPQYMSPEQATGDRVLDARSDVYSLAAVLYEMLSGEPPHSGATAQAVIAKLMTERPTRLRVIRDTVPEGVEAAVAKALSKVPSDRFGSAAAFTAALSDPYRSAPAEPEPERTPARRLPAAVVVTLLVVGLAIAGTLLVRRPAPAPPPSQRQLTFTGRASQPAISPDGKRVAYVVSGRSLVVQSLDGGEPIELVPPARFLLTARWTRDGSALLFTMFRDTVVNGQIKLAGTWMVPSGGGPPREVLPDIGGFDAGPDSLTAIWAQPPGIEVVELPSGDRPLKIRTSIPIADSLGPLFEVAWSPDRRWIAFMTAGKFVGLVAATGGELRGIARAGRSPRWGPSGRMLYFLQDTSGVTELRRVAIDPAKGMPLGPIERVLNLPSASEFDLRQGTLVYTQQATSQQAVAFTLAPGGGLAETHPLTQGTATVGSVSITPDGLKVAYDRTTGGKTGVAVVPFAGGPAQSLPAVLGKQTRPTWAPDGATMAFINTDSTGKSRVMVARFPDGSARPVGAAAPSWPTMAWSGDGRWLAYPAGVKRIALLDLRSQAESFETLPDSFGGLVPTSGIALSADGKQLAVATYHRLTDWYKLAFAMLDKHSWRRIPEPFGESGLPRWGSDGWLYLVNGRTLMGESGRFRYELWRTRPPEGTPQFLAELPEGSDDCSVAADGRRGACVQTAVTSDLLVVTGLPVEDPH